MEQKKIGFGVLWHLHFISYLTSFVIRGGRDWVAKDGVELFGCGIH